MKFNRKIEIDMKIKEIFTDLRIPFLYIDLYFNINFFLVNLDMDEVSLLKKIHVNQLFSELRDHISFNSSILPASVTI